MDMQKYPNILDTFSRDAHLLQRIQDAAEGRVLMRLEVDAYVLRACPWSRRHTADDPASLTLGAASGRFAPCTRDAAASCWATLCAGAPVYRCPWSVQALRVIGFRIQLSGDRITLGPGAQVWAWPGITIPGDHRRPGIGTFDPESVRLLEDGEP